MQSRSHDDVVDLRNVVEDRAVGGAVQGAPKDRVMTPKSAGGGASYANRSKYQEIIHSRSHVRE